MDCIVHGVAKSQTRKVSSLHSCIAGGFFTTEPSGNSKIMMRVRLFFQIKRPPKKYRLEIPTTVTDSKKPGLFHLLGNYIKLRDIK